MFQVIIHGRGGQGAKTMAMLLAQTAIESGKFAQAFPEYGPERTGAPVRSYLRLNSNKIITREPIMKADLVIVLDDSLLLDKEVLETLRANPVLLINTRKNQEEILETILQRINFDGKIRLIDAYEFIEDAKNKIHFSTPIFGKFIKLNELISLDDFKKVYKDKFLTKLGQDVIEESFKVLEKGYDSL
ncbi:MAG: hypothetical protein GF335_00030 [Candidatus Moranbacteria bacterium]|nr:hypothetical protein [Candidatus Moranbacteria bacterium]